MLSAELNEQGVESKLCFDKKIKETNHFLSIAHGLWQWPSSLASTLYRNKKIPYLIFPHGMLDPWFKKTFPFKHFKKQLYWWWRQGRILKDAQAVCFTTEEERRLARKTFRPYEANEVVTGLGVGDPPGNEEKQRKEFFLRFPELVDRKLLLYLGRMHPKKGLDLLKWMMNRLKKL